VLSLQLAPEPAWQPRGGSRRGFNRLGLSVRYSATQNSAIRDCLSALEAENAPLRSSVVDFALQMQALRDV
jgi:hypothetical protein